MILRHYPSVYNDRDARIAPKRGGPVKLGTFGAVVAVYRLAFDSVSQADSDGRLYFPVDTEEEANEMITKLNNENIVDYVVARPVYEKVYFIPNGET